MQTNNDDQFIILNEFSQLQQHMMHRMGANALKHFITITVFGIYARISVNLQSAEMLLSR